MLKFFALLNKFYTGTITGQIDIETLAITGIGSGTIAASVSTGEKLSQPCTGDLQGFLGENKNIAQGNMNIYYYDWYGHNLSSQVNWSVFK